jgi:predicted TIM-barrel fold metal-dependent hydrolase
MKRRHFLATLGGGAARMFVSRQSAPVLAQTSPAVRAAASEAANRIDIHQHFVSPTFLETLNDKSARMRIPGLAAWKDYSPARAVEALDRVGIEKAMLSITAPGVHFGNPGEARKLAREMNDFAVARMVNAYKGRFGLFAVLPVPDVPGTLQEISYAFDDLKADGVGILTSYGNLWLGDLSFAPIFEELNRRKAIVYTHPTDAQCCQDLIPGVANQMLEYPTDTTRTIASLLSSGAASKYPDIRFIFSHAGGTLTSVAARMLGPTAPPDVFSRPAEPDSRLFHLRRFYYDTAGATNPVTLQALKTLVPVSQILFGTDSPFFDGAPQTRGLRASGLTAAEVRQIERDNALQLLKKV